jgi:hypothetical protein
MRVYLVTFVAAFFASALVFLVVDYALMSMQGLPLIYRP